MIRRRALSLTLAAAALLGAAPLAAQAPVPFRTPELEMLLPAGFAQPERVNPEGMGDGPAVYASERAANGGVALIMVVRLSAAELEEYGTREAALEEALAGIATTGATLGARTAVDDSTSIGFVTRVRQDGDDDAPMLRASITRGGPAAVLVLVFLGPTDAGGPPPVEYVASLASLRLRAPAGS